MVRINFPIPCGLIVVTKCLVMVWIEIVCPFGILTVSLRLGFASPDNQLRLLRVADNTSEDSFKRVTLKSTESPFNRMSRLQTFKKESVLTGAERTWSDYAFYGLISDDKSQLIVYLASLRKGILDISNYYF